MLSCVSLVCEVRGSREMIVKVTKSTVKRLSRDASGLWRVRCGHVRAPRHRPHPVLPLLRCEIRGKRISTIFEHCILHTFFHVLTEQYHVHTTTGSRVLGARIRSSSHIARMTSAFAVLPMLSVFVVNANERPASGRVRVRVRIWVWVWVWARVRVRLG